MSELSERDQKLLKSMVQAGFLHGPVAMPIAWVLQIGGAVAGLGGLFLMAGAIHDVAADKGRVAYYGLAAVIGVMCQLLGVLVGTTARVARLMRKIAPQEAP